MGFYFNSVNKISGVTNYIAMDNITNQPNFDTQIENGNDYTFDLNGYFVALDTTKDYSSTSVVNGILVSGNFKTSSDPSSYGLTKKEQFTPTNSSASDGGMSQLGENNKVEYDGYVFRDMGYEGTKLNKEITFKNCYFYGSDITSNKSMTFENCYFIDGYKTKKGSSIACIQIYSDDTSVTTINIKNCTFTNTKRGINYISNNDNLTLNIESCTFNGVEDKKFAALQIASIKGTINFKNNIINSLGGADAIIRYHESYFKNSNNTTAATDQLDKVVFDNNKVSSKISTSNYVDLDDGRKSIDGIANSSKFYEEALKRFKDNAATF